MGVAEMALAGLAGALAAAAHLRGLWLALAVRRAPPPPAPPPPSPPVRRPPRGSADWLLAPPELDATRRALLRREVEAVVALCGGREDARRRSARLLQLPDETLAALIYVVIADPRIERVTVRQTPEALRVVDALQKIKDLA